MATGDDEIPVRAVRPGLAGVFMIGLGYGAAVFLALLADAGLQHRPLETRLLGALACFAAGAAIGAVIAWLIAARLSAGRPRHARLALLLLLAVIGTAGSAAFFFFLEFRLSHAYMHAPLTADWVIETLTSGAAAGFTFAVLGLPLFVPFGLIPLFALAFYFAARSGDGL